MKKMISFRLEEESISKLNELSSIQGVSRTVFIENIINNYSDQLYRSSPHEENKLVLSLLSQLEEKDKQILAKDFQINNLIDQSKNYQILLKGEQDKVLLLSQSKQSFIKLLFSKK